MKKLIVNQPNYPLFPSWEQSIYNQPKLVSEIVNHGQSPLALLVSSNVK